MAILARVNAALGHFEAEAAGLSAKEMVARKHLQREGSTRLVSPRFQVIVADLDILQATKSRNWAHSSAGSV